MQKVFDDYMCAAKFLLNYSRSLNSSFKKSAMPTFRLKSNSIVYGLACTGPGLNNTQQTCSPFLLCRHGAAIHALKVALIRENVIPDIHMEKPCLSEAITVI
jgi:hypothetical protein